MSLLLEEDGQAEHRRLLKDLIWSPFKSSPTSTTGFDMVPFSNRLLHLPQDLIWSPFRLSHTWAPFFNCYLYFFAEDKCVCLSGWSCSITWLNKLECVCCRPLYRGGRMTALEKQGNYWKLLSLPVQTGLLSARTG